MRVSRARSDSFFATAAGSPLQNAMARRAGQQVGEAVVAGALGGDAGERVLRDAERRVERTQAACGRREMAATESPR